MSTWSYIMRAWRFLDAPTFGFLSYFHAIMIAVWSGVFVYRSERLLSGSGDLYDILLMATGAFLLGAVLTVDAQDHHLKNTHGVDPKLLCKYGVVMHMEETEVEEEAV